VPRFGGFLRLYAVSSIETHARAELFPFLSGIARACVVTAPAEGIAVLSVLIGVLIICVVGAICFWAIDKFVRESRLAGLLKLLVVLICLASILQRVLPLAGINVM
jgi:hypothetical protein